MGLLTTAFLTMQREMSFLQALALYSKAKVLVASSLV